MNNHKLCKELKYSVPEISESIEYIKQLKKDSVHKRLKKASATNSLLFQPRGGVGLFDDMKDLLVKMEKEAKPNILPVTIDSYTRLNKFKELENINFDNLNGYPLCHHGWKKTRLLNEKLKTPLQIRHGSPDPRILFDYSIASGITAFEGGGISYNIPYCKDIPLEDSLRNWEYVDRFCGFLAKKRIIVDRELFGSLTGVLVPPAISIAISLLEALLTTMHGVKCISISFPQTGNIIQDVASFRTIRELIKKYLPRKVEYYTVLHEFMGVFPKKMTEANALILFGGLTAKLCKANKIITKTNQEAVGIPTVEANINGIQISQSGYSRIFNFIELREEKIEEEKYWIKREVNELLAPALEYGNLKKGVIYAFRKGYLDIPFGASRFNHSKVIPLRDDSGAIRFYENGNLPLSFEVKQKNKEHFKLNSTDKSDKIFETYNMILKSINYFYEK